MKRVCKFVLCVNIVSDTLYLVNLTNETAEYYDGGWHSSAFSWTYSEVYDFTVFEHLETFKEAV
jgi:hypothetical protein